MTKEQILGKELRFRLEESTTRRLVEKEVFLVPINIRKEEKLYTKDFPEYLREFNLKHIENGEQYMMGLTRLLGVPGIKTLCGTSIIVNTDFAQIFNKNRVHNNYECLMTITPPDHNYNSEVEMCKLYGTPCWQWDSKFILIAQK